MIEIEYVIKYQGKRAGFNHKSDWITFQYILSSDGIPFIAVIQGKGTGVW